MHMFGSIHAISIYLFMLHANLIKLQNRSAFEILTEYLDEDFIPSIGKPIVS